ncbi:4-hydroxythreonine-4-phosphate dehydrogenase PdxA [bacterium]|nr:4-hydroxythreonine-4-phosphate dehydrogenase PdxA [bacterium]
MKVIGISTGDPTGIGPEVTAKALRYHNLLPDIAIVVYGKFITSNNGHQPIKIHDISQVRHGACLYHLEIDNPELSLGNPSAESGKVAIAILDKIVEDVKNKHLDALVTAPVSKKHIRDTGYDFIGHTEFLQTKLAADNVAMTFWSDDLKVGLLTTHLPLHQLEKVLTPEYCQAKLKLIYSEVNKLMKDPKIALLAKNPHAGEHGAFGETDEMFKKLLVELSQENIHIAGPFPADTFFSYNRQEYDFIISSYHDQGLIPFKMLAGGKGVNVTLGLPVYRASAEHGTAFDIAQDNKADFSSMQSAIYWVEDKLSQHHKLSKEYGEFSNFYDNYMAHVNYDQWTAKINVWIDQYAKDKPKRIFEIACGTGEITRRLVGDEREVMGGDISEIMLHLAEKKCPEITLHRHNMLDPLPVENLDLAVCVFDSINYLLEEKLVLNLFQNVYTALNPKGLFIFDISTIFNSEENLDGFINYEEYANYKVLHTSDWDPDNETQKSYLDIFKKNKTIYQNFSETHYQKIYSVRQIRALLEDSGLEILAIYNGTDNLNLINYYPEDLDERFSRIYFIVNK